MSQLSRAFTRGARFRAESAPRTVRIIDPTHGDRLLDGWFELPPASAREKQAKPLPLEVVSDGKGVRTHVADLGEGAAMMRLGESASGGIAGVWELDSGRWRGSARGCFGEDPNTCIFWSADHLVCAPIGSLGRGVKANGGATDAPPEEAVWTIPCRRHAADEVTGVARSRTSDDVVVGFGGVVPALYVFDVRRRVLRWTFDLGFLSSIGAPSIDPSGRWCFIGVGAREPEVSHVALGIVDLREGGGSSFALPAPSAGVARAEALRITRIEFPAQGKVDVFRTAIRSTRRGPPRTRTERLRLQFCVDEGSWFPRVTAR